MSEVFTDIIFEVNISGTWTDITADVQHEPEPVFSRGIQGSKYQDRVADPGRLTFSLNNSASNSAGLVGYYTPGHANVRSGWTVSLPVRVRFQYDTWDVIKWYGRIEPDGIQVDAGVYSNRRVNVRCVDFMGLAARHKLNLISPAANVSITTAIDTLLDNMPIQPQETEYESAFTANFVYMFDITGTETTVMGEFQKIATGFRATSGTPGFGHIVTRGGGTYGEKLYAQVTIPGDTFLPAPLAESDNLLLETGDDLLQETGDFILLDQLGTTAAGFTDDDMLPGSRFVYGADIVNRVTIVSYPRRVDAAATTVLWTLDDPVELSAGMSTTIRGAYNNPTGGTKINGIDFVDPLVSGTDYKANAAADGAGADMTASLGVTAEFGAAEVELTLINNHGSTPLFVGGGTAGAFLQVRGKGVYIEDTARQVVKDQTSIDTHGEHTLTIDSKYMDLSQNFNTTPSYGQSIINAYKDPHTTIERLYFCANKDVSNLVRFLFLESRMFVNITESMNALSGTDFFLQGYEARIVDGKTVFWDASFKRSA